MNLKSEGSIALSRAHVAEMFAHAVRVSPEECCGLIGGREGISMNVYPLHNTADAPEVRYEARPEDLFAAQKSMRARHEELLAIYHSHPREADPEPSETDVRLAYYPGVVYFIIGFSERVPVLRGFLIHADDMRWEPFEFRVL